MINNSKLQFLFRLILGGVFIWAGVVKIAAPLDFAQDIANYQIFPDSLSFFLALILPYVEVLCGILIVAGIIPRAGAFVLSGLLVGFLLLIVITMIRGIDVECGCFGSLGRKVDYKLLLTDLGLLFLGLNIFLCRKTGKP
jgi:putative oxidoreductase